MKAAVLYEFNQGLKVEKDVELKDPRQGEVLVKLAASGVCHSDLSIAKGILPLPPPIIIGHEGAGIVEKVGSGVSSVKPGDHVVLTWMYPCGRCRDCGQGRPQHCEKALEAMSQGSMFDGTTRFRVKGDDMRHWVGTFAEYTVVPEQGVVEIRRDAPLDKAALLGCGVMTGVGAVINTAKVEVGASVAVFGAGGVGLNVIQGAALTGADKIIAIDLVEGKLQLARQFGATHTVNASKTEPVSAIREINGGRGTDYAFEVIGNPTVIAQAFSAIRRGGKVVVVGVPPISSELTIPAFSIPLEEKSIIGSFYGSPRFHYDMPRLIDLYMAGKLKLDELVSRTLRLEEINTAFDLMEKGEVARSVILY